MEEQKFGKEYLKALDKVLNIRAERRLDYGDSFLNDTIESLLTIIDGKRNRFNVLMKSETKNVPRIEDQIIDMINYYLFILCIIDKNGIKTNTR